MIPAYSAVYNIGRYSAEASVAMIPRRPDPTKRAVIYAHGANGNGGQAIGVGSSVSMPKMFGPIVMELGLVVLSGDFGGPQTYGNDAEVAQMELAWNWLKASGLCATDKVILTGASMGSLSCHRFAFDHPELVAGMNLWMPAIDIEDVRNRNVLGLRDNVDAAWGLPAGSYLSAGGSPIPTRGRILDHPTTYDPMPTHIHYSTADTAATPAAVDAYAAARSNVTKHITSTTADHTDAITAGTDVSVLLAFIDSIA